MSNGWEAVPPLSQAGDAVEIRIIDREGGPGGRLVCVATGSLLYREAEDNFVKLLDEDDVANARPIAAAPEMRRIIAELVKQTKGGEGVGLQILQDAEEVLAKIARPQAS